VILTHLIGLTSQDERDTLSIDDQVQVAYSRLEVKNKPDWDALSADEQAQIRSTLRVYDLFCADCGTPHRTYLPPDAETFTCEECT
jgi:hypothetical protein